ncbi:MAG: AAA ATPase central domain protein [Candidatus Moranbacteria bacterium GW2011_GWD2_36_12]|nr:MAG: AAA ATPase central domain protein [Candidatus Moranbacteria bacterium GW2011_GWD2_36_12]KKQ05999.1 MAG: AAA ATPase central domain protein [Candidatus Moranbacteria bacterium GW2011_GWE2_36_40]
MEKQKNINNAPLADRMRPQTLEEFFGQQELVGEKSFLKKAIVDDQVPSMILWGPPGSGKTTLAEIIANETKSDFIKISAVTSGIKELRKTISKAEENQWQQKKTILFVDEIHRWNKAQQDALLPHVERGLMTLIGATTENPSFEVNSALVSRTRVFVLNKLEVEDLEKIIQKALTDKENGLGEKEIEIAPEMINEIALLANGDARMALNTLEAAANQSSIITRELLRQIIQKSHLYYDKGGEEHYNIISALHKSMRGGDADASVYWLARMLEGGEQPTYIARRLLRFASEDVGLADNYALMLANNVFDACHKLGYPECSVHLSQLVIYLAKAPKSVSAYFAYNKAKKDVQDFGNLPVPMHIRNAPTKLMEKLGYGKGYKYTPVEDSEGQEYLPNELKKRKYL